MPKMYQNDELVERTTFSLVTKIETNIEKIMSSQIIWVQFSHNTNFQLICISNLR